jgi:Protein of unknown function (DUF3465)
MITITSGVSEMRQLGKMANSMKKILPIVILLAIVYIGSRRNGFNPVPQGQVVEDIGKADQLLAEAFAQHRRNIQIQNTGRVVRLLPEDDDGIRHQKFIVELNSGQKLLVAHNIDVAGRVTPLRPEDEIEFRGEYEWNEQGGVIHWTHRDPQHRHADGWIKHNGRTFE